MPKIKQGVATILDIPFRQLSEPDKCAGSFHKPIQHRNRLVFFPAHTKIVFFDDCF